jgi:hypothetical protein
LITDNKVTTFLQADSNTTSNLPPTDHEWPLCDQTDHYVTTMWPLFKKNWPVKVVTLQEWLK